MTSKRITNTLEVIFTPSSKRDRKHLNGVLELAQESEMPRAYEVAGQLIKNVADATDKLLDLQKKLKDVEAEEKGQRTIYRQQRTVRWFNSRPWQRC